MIPKDLQEVAEYLRGANFTLPTTGTDGRTDSNVGEERVISALQDEASDRGWVIKSSNFSRTDNRSWYDVKINGHYCNIKISRCNGNADNANAKKAIYYFITGDEGSNVTSRESVFFQRLKEKENPDEERDYFYLIVNKSDTGDVFFVSLKGLETCSPNPRNMPFQVVWEKNRTTVKRTWDEAREFLLGKYADCFKGLARLTLEGMPKHYPEFFDDGDIDFRKKNEDQ